MSRSVEPLEPLHPGKLGVYGCGPTLYGHAHIGNFRTFLLYDLIHRYLEWRGFDVRFVMNMTDVDDKTIAGAHERGVDLNAYTTPYLDAVLEESDALGLRRFDGYPRATEHVGGMISLIQTLLDRKLAYSTPDGSVFFDISSFPGYGRLSRKDLEQARVGERVASDDYGKDDVRDFALWKGAKEADESVGAAWDAPWGRGRPGWHIECSVMALAEIGDTVDLHLGGEDLIFPHHEDEIAQSEGATGRPFVRVWLHGKHLRVEGRKMSKSLGNVLRVRDLLDEGVAPVAIRHLLLSAHYRSELNFTREGLEASARAVGRLVELKRRLDSHAAVGGAAGTDLGRISREALDAFTTAMDDDLNVAGALAALFVFLNRVNGVLDQAREIDPAERDAALSALGDMDSVFGLLELAERAAPIDEGLAAWVEERIEARAKARRERDWKAADAIRDELAARGVAIEDGAGGTRWKLTG
jgi:cysteinyl-tRNA synthetase